MSIGPEVVPVIFSALGVGIGLAWAVINGNRAYAREALTQQITVLQGLIDAKDRDREQGRQERLKLEQENVQLTVKLSRCEAQLAASRPA
jgi:hypothetical protein